MPMHDPLSVAFEVKTPWYRTVRMGGGSVWRYHPAIITVWHRGEHIRRRERWPEPEGAAERLLREMADWESRYPHWFTAEGGDQAAKLLALWDTFAWRLNYSAPWYTRLWRPRQVPNRMVRLALWLIGNEHDNLREPFTVKDPSTLAVRAPVSTKMEYRSGDPPTGSGRPGLSAEDAYQRLRHLWAIYQREVLPVKNRWRFDVRNWEVQVHPLQMLRRWLLTRCVRCGRGFRWGATIVATGWDRERTPWWRGERGCMHEDCSGVSVAAKTEKQP